MVEPTPSPPNRKSKIKAQIRVHPCPSVVASPQCAPPRSDERRPAHRSPPPSPTTSSPAPSHEFPTPHPRSSVSIRGCTPESCLRVTPHSDHSWWNPPPLRPIENQKSKIENSGQPPQPGSDRLPITNTATQTWATKHGDAEIAQTCCGGACFPFPNPLPRSDPPTLRRSSPLPAVTHVALHHPRRPGCDPLLMKFPSSNQCSSAFCAFTSAASPPFTPPVSLSRFTHHASRLCPKNNSRNEPSSSASTKPTARSNTPTWSSLLSALQS